MVTFKVFRYDPDLNEKPRYDEFKVPVDSSTTVLEGLYYILENLDTSLAWRSSCRAAVCGSCGMKINGQFALACRTLVNSLKTKVITVEPLAHLNVIKDLVVDMDDFYNKYEVVEPYLIPKEIPVEHKEFYQSKKDRKKLDGLVECILCGSCYAACTVCHWDNEFPGPYALLAADAKLKDNRDQKGDERLQKIMSESGIWRCHTELRCADACPKDLKPTESINHLKRQAVKYRFTSLLGKKLKSIEKESKNVLDEGPVMDRQNFLQTVFFGLAGILTASMAGIFALPLLLKQSSSKDEEWIKAEPLPPMDVGKPVEVIYKKQVWERGKLRMNPQRVYIVKDKTNKIIAIDPACTHLGCICYWDEAIRMFMCPCHGGAFDYNGKVKLGPPPGPLKRIDVKIAKGMLYIRNKQEA